MGRPSSSSRRRALLAGTDSGRDALRRIAVALSALAAVTVVGTVGYTALGFPLLDALYQTVTTVATVGFREVRPLGPGGQLFTIVLILLGVGTVLYNLGVLVEAVTEGHLREHLGRRRMERDIARLRDHVIVCGFGRVGRSATRYLHDRGHRVVVVDTDETRLDGLTEPFVHGDAANDDVLRAAGIERARALVCALDTDAATTYATLSARALRPDLVIISRARTLGSKDKLVLAGATRAVNPQLIGGRRMASFALHADVAEFLDEVMHDDDLDVRIEQVRLGESDAVVGRTLGEVDVPGTCGCQLLAVRAPRKGAFTPSPPADRVLEAGATLIVFGTPEQVGRLRALAASGRPVSAVEGTLGG
ncbi:potassium channel family protein [Phycicoccus sonneratiae]|uniref:Potassium channel protein n=1 Tax=Phycicoccus sonneratiae TaxID=2807628 RepID=A0ABS2CKE3_9MICO|nr:potassium channel protein [Phycicoccus sonneraticus]MBM6400351.1 potassium channel protein [Phycicoccus sonneraticus]